MEMFRVQFLVEDKNLARAKRVLAGMARELRDEPVVNAGAYGKNGVRALTGGSTVELLAAHIKKRKITQMTPRELGDFVVSVGRSRNSYSNMLRGALDTKLLRMKPGSSTTSRTYLVVAALPKPKLKKKPAP